MKDSKALKRLLLMFSTSLIACRLSFCDARGTCVVRAPAVSTLAKCFLNTAIFDYMVVSSRAKGARQVASSGATGARKVASSGAKGARQEEASRRRPLAPSMPALIPVSQRRARSVAIDDNDDKPPEKLVSAGENEGKDDGLDRGEWPIANVAEMYDSGDKGAETDSSEDEVDSSEGETVPYQAPVVKRNKYRAGK